MSDLIIEWTIYEAFCKTAPASQGLLNRCIGPYLLPETFKKTYNNIFELCCIKLLLSGKEPFSTVQNRWTVAGQYHGVETIVAHGIRMVYTWYRLELMVWISTWTYGIV